MLKIQKLFAACYNLWFVREFPMDNFPYANILGLNLKFFITHLLNIIARKLIKTGVKILQSNTSEFIYMKHNGNFLFFFPQSLLLNKNNECFALVNIWLKYEVFFLLNNVKKTIRNAFKCNWILVSICVFVGFFFLLDKETESLRLKVLINVQV